VAADSGGAAAIRVPWEAAVRRLLEFDTAGQWSPRHVQLEAASAGICERTMWRWLERGRSTGAAGTP
jgi:putative transposase